MSPQVVGVGTRPRIEGVRETEILEAALEVLAEVGYDRLTMDAVALRAKASTARSAWSSTPCTTITIRRTPRRRSTPVRCVVT